MVVKVITTINNKQKDYNAKWQAYKTKRKGYHN